MGLHQPDARATDGVARGEIELNGRFLDRPPAAGAWDDLLRTAPGAIFFQSHGSAREAGDRPRLEMVLDAANLLPFHFLRTGDRMGRAVVKIRRDDGATGTGFLVAPDILLTNHHVLPDKATAGSSVALANYEVSPPNDPTGRPASMPLDPSALFVTDAGLDFTFCGVHGLDYLGAVPLDRERMQINVDETVTIIQHPRGRPKEVALRENRVVHADAVVLQYACDTEPGSSGSPVFNDQWKPVAIHHASVLTDSPEGRRVALGSRARYLNEGIRLSAIALWLETAEANTPGRRDLVARLRALFGGLDPRAGFFGALGRRSHGRPAAEVVAEGDRDRLDVLDIGFWDTRALAHARGGLRDRAADLGRVVADMGLDVWCLSHADPAGLDAVCERLWAAHGLCYQPIPIGPASAEGGAPGVLVRPSRTLVAEPVADEASRSLPRVRLRASTRAGGEVEFQLVPMARGSARGPGLAELIGSIRRDASPDGPGWVLLVDADLAFATDGLVALSETDGPVLAAAAPRDGAVVLMVDGVPRVGQVFVSPNLRPAVDPDGRLAPAIDRTLPASLAALGGPQPFALRITLDRADPSPPDEPAAPRLLDTPSPPQELGGLEALIERKLRDLLSPVIARLLDEGRGPRGS